ncbi:reverse transcriptase domain-containing protein [Trichonephila clavata]|uniref:Reverse transcriptase domain-containing protein n=1 Tax=Trichonephila clavata TaxID=2740835 RepID=A0A8X6KTV1_TRICU|nr:reverse transcriptase domain-containing protein [Trichonephila clavata]
MNTDNSLFPSDFTVAELESAIECLDPKKFLGPDLQMITHFGGNAKRYLLNIFNTLWRSGKLPKIWKNSVIIPILKPGKAATNCKHNRPISLTCILCKLMERIIHTRLMQWIIKNNVLHFYQTAYRAKHSAVDQLFYHCQSVIDGFQEKSHKKTNMVS